MAEANALFSYDVGWHGTTSAAGQKEIVSDVLTQLTPEDKPTLAVIGKDVADGLYWEWMTDRLAARTTAAALEGAAASYDAAVTRKKLANYVQHMQGGFAVTLDQIEMSRRGKTIGVKDEFRYQAGKRMSEKQLDLNTRAWSLCPSGTTADSSAATDAPSSGSSSTGPISGNFHYWARNSVATATSAFLGVAQATQFKYTAGSFSSADLNTVTKAMFDNGTRPNTIFCGHAVKLAMDSAFFNQTASGTLIRNTDALQGSEYGATIEVIKTSIGRFAIIVDHTMPAQTSGTSAAAKWSDAAWYVAKREDMKLATWREFAPYDIPSAGDSVCGYVRGSYGFKITNPFSIGGVYGVTDV